MKKQKQTQHEDIPIQCKACWNREAIEKKLEKAKQQTAKEIRNWLDKQEGHEMINTRIISLKIFDIEFLGEKE